MKRTFRRAASFVGASGSTTNISKIQRVIPSSTITTTTKRFYNHSSNSSNSNRRAMLIGSSALMASLLLYQSTRNDENNEKQLHAEEQQQEKNAVNRPLYTKAQVALHKTKSTGIWVTFKNGVYDITKFVDKHPGGEKILLAAGGAIDPFWSMYAIHKKPEILDILEEYRIGDLVESEREEKDYSDPYVNDPDRLPLLKINSAKPFNAETPAAILVDKFITPNEIFYVRNHLPVPVVEEQKYELVITGTGVEEVRLTLDDLKNKFHPVSVVTTMQCAGNRRREMSDAKPVKGLEWSIGAISTAEWTGVKLRDVLQYAGLDVSRLESEDDDRMQHIQFEGLDKDVTGANFGGSIPISKAIDKHGDVILAFKMNGVDIPRDHGFPVRAIVPGIVGARNVKWVTKVIVSDIESQSFWQQKDYRSFPPSKDFGEGLDISKAPAIQDLPVQSAICEPQDHQTIRADQEEVTVKGYAWSGGGRDIIRVDVTADMGNYWHEADLRKEIKQMPGRAWAWTPFEATVAIPKDEAQKEMTVCSKAVDSANSVQPEHVESIWNARGFMNNSWSCVHLHIDRSIREDEYDDEE